MYLYDEIYVCYSDHPFEAGEAEVVVHEDVESAREIEESTVEAIIEVPNQDL